MLGVVHCLPCETEGAFSGQARGARAEKGPSPLSCSQLCRDRKLWCPLSSWQSSASCAAVPGARAIMGHYLTQHVPSLARLSG